MNKFISCLIVCFFVCFGTEASAQKSPSPFRDPYAAQPATPPAAAQPAAQPATPATGQPGPRVGGNGGTGKPKDKEAAPTDCHPFGERKDPKEGEDKCLTADEWVEAKEKAAREEGGKSARLYGWLASVGLCLAFLTTVFWMWFKVIRPRLNRFAGVITKKLDPRIEALEKRADDAEATVNQLQTLVVSLGGKPPPKRP